MTDDQEKAAEKLNRPEPQILDLETHEDPDRHRSDSIGTDSVQAGSMQLVEDHTTIKSEGIEQSSRLPLDAEAGEKLDEELIKLTQTGTDSSGDSDSGGDSNDADQTNEFRRRRSRTEFTDGKSLMLVEVRENALRANPKLRTNLSGKLLVKLDDKRESYLLDWTKKDPVSLADDAKADCRIMLSENDLLNVARGKLNPQIGMLAGKIRVEGNVGLAVYFF